MSEYGNKELVFLSFADSRYYSSLERLQKQTEYFGFTKRYFYTEKDLPKDFFSHLNPKLYRRGYAYWTWKPYIVQRVLNDLKDGDILVYSDGGNQFDMRALPHFEKYISMLDMSMPILAFQQPYLEKDWTKMDVFAHICPKNYLSYAMGLQLWGGCFILMKSELSTRLLDTWNEIRVNHLDLFTDKISQMPNLKGFQENRHDQSIFSLLVKQLPHHEISWTEVEGIDGKWNQQAIYPIQARRSRSASRKSWFINRILLRPLRYLQGMYLVLFKHFYFKNKIAWSIISVVGCSTQTVLAKLGGVSAMMPLE